MPAVIVAWLPVVAYAALVWFVSGLALPSASSDFPGRDKLVHAVEFAALGWLVARALVRTARPAADGLWRLGVVAVLVCAGWGFLDEIHQASVPTRSASVWDFAADTAGASVGVLAYIARRTKRDATAAPVPSRTGIESERG
ncbi:MAG: VanZ family protein [Deltaproteobacteria bacterium]|nr:VanZ family protein [Deltaproteobacteria bacterium]